MRKPYQVREVGPKGKSWGRQVFSACVHCGRDATKEALFKANGITIVEKYCDDCLKAEKFTAIMTFYGRT